MARLEKGNNGFYFYSKEVTPISGRAKWAKVNVPDTKFNSDGVYSVSLVVSPEDAEPLIERLEEIRKENKEGYTKNSKGKKIRWNPHFKEEMENKGTKEDPDYQPTGNYEFSFKLKAKKKNYKTGNLYDTKVVVVDAKGKPIEKALEIGNGSLIKVAFIPSPYYTAAVGGGVSKELFAIQILDLVEFNQAGGGDVTDLFGEEEGFTYDDAGEDVFDEDTIQEEEEVTEEVDDDDEDF